MQLPGISQLRYLLYKYKYINKSKWISKQLWFSDLNSAPCQDRSESRHPRRDLPGWIGSGHHRSLCLQSLPSWRVVPLPPPCSGHEPRPMQSIERPARCRRMIKDEGTPFLSMTFRWWGSGCVKVFWLGSWLLMCAGAVGGCGGLRGAAWGLLEGCWRLLGVAGGCWGLLGVAGGCWGLLAAAGKLKIIGIIIVWALLRTGHKWHQWRKSNDPKVWGKFTSNQSNLAKIGAKFGVQWNSSVSSATGNFPFPLATTCSQLQQETICSCFQVTPWRSWSFFHGSQCKTGIWSIR